MSELLALGASHKTAPLAVRERLALLDGQVEPFLQELTAHPGVTEAVAVSTCNRTELYVVGEDPEARGRGMLAARAGGRRGALYTARNCDAARHLYRVVSGLDSMIVGEAEIQGQVKRAYERALAAHTTGPMTNKLFRAALATGKRVRTETAISVRQRVRGVGRGRVRPGGGRRARLRATSCWSARARTPSRSRAPSPRTASRRCSWPTAAATARSPSRSASAASSGSFDALPAELVRADVVVSSTSSPHAIIEAEELAAVMEERGGRPLLLVDLAVPRDIAPVVRRASTA